LLVLGVGLTLIVLLVSQVRYERELNAYRKMRVMQINEQEPGFERFYANWYANWKITKQQKSIEQAVTEAAIALAAIGGAVAGTEEQRMRRVLDEELRTHLTHGCHCEFTLRSNLVAAAGLLRRRRLSPRNDLRNERYVSTARD
jgi:hypothetical protein